MKFGYARESKLEKKLDRQINKLIDQGVQEANIYKEKITGAIMAIPQFDNFMMVAQPGDVIIVTELTRLGGSVKDLINIIEELKNKQVELIALKENIDTRTDIGKMIFRVSSIFSQFERDILSERTKEGLKAARARGKKGGRPSIPSERIEAALLLYGLNPRIDIKDICTMANISKATLFKYVKIEKGKNKEIKNSEKQRKEWSV